MVQAAFKPLIFEDYLKLYPEDGGRYELKDGELVEMRPRRPHEGISGLIAFELESLARQLNLSYFVPCSCSIKPPRLNTGYLPDVVLSDETKVNADPYWNKASIISIPKPLFIVSRLLAPIGVMTTATS